MESAGTGLALQDVGGDSSAIVDTAAEPITPSTVAEKGVGRLRSRPTVSTIAPVGSTWTGATAVEEVTAAD